MARQYNACNSRVHNRGVPPPDFLDELIEWGKKAPDELFSWNERRDIYANIVADVGPWQGLLHRKAAMLEVLRVLAGFESSWKWHEGRDVTNPASNTSCTEEAGIFQCSGDSMSIDKSLRNELVIRTGKSDCNTFRFQTKADHEFAIQYCARLLRFTVNHHGPVKRKEINAWLSNDAIEEFTVFLTADT